MKRRYDLVVLGGGTAGLIASLYAARVVARVMERVQAVIRQAGVRDTAEHLESEGVEVVRAFGRFAQPGVIDADGRGLRYRAAIVATGSRPAVPPIPGLADADFLTNETVFELRELPAQLTVLGGGAMGCELGQAFVRLGSGVQIVEAEPTLLPAEDREAGCFIGQAT